MTSKLTCWQQSRVSNFPPKRVNRFSPKILHFSHFVCLFLRNFALICFAKCENVKISRKKNGKIFGEKNAKILRAQYLREIIYYDIIKLLMLSSQSREVFLRNLLLQPMVSGIFPPKTIFAFFRLIHFREKMQNFAKSLRNSHERFLIFSRKFSFARNPRRHPFPRTNAKPLSCLE